MHSVHRYCTFICLFVFIDTRLLHSLSVAETVYKQLTDNGRCSSIIIAGMLLATESNRCWIWNEIITAVIVCELEFVPPADFTQSHTTRVLEPTEVCTITWSLGIFFSSLWCTSTGKELKIKSIWKRERTSACNGYFRLALAQRRCRFCVILSHNCFLSIAHENQITKTYLSFFLSDSAIFFSEIFVHGHTHTRAHDT